MREYTVKTNFSVSTSHSKKSNVTVIVIILLHNSEVFLPDTSAYAPPGQGLTRLSHLMEG